MILGGMSSAVAFSPPLERSNATTIAYAGLGVSTVGWAAGFVAGKFALVEMTPLAVAAWRYAVAASILLPFALRGRPRAGIADVAGPLAVMVVCGGVLYPTLFLLALQGTSATNTSLLIALNPVITLLFSPFVGERIDRRRVGGMLLALAGAAVVITRGSFEHLRALSFNSGDLLALAAATMWATFNLTSRRVAGRLTPPFTNCVIYALGGVALYGLGLPEHPWAQLTAATSTALSGIVIMAVLSSVVAGHLFLVGIRTVGVNRTVVFIYVVPVLTALMSAVLLHEEFEVAQAVGGAAVLAGVWWTTRTPQTVGATTSG
jgi:drug/metabolite transporter (DMT)-like permease